MASAGKTVITGGAGFIGSHLVDRLLIDGCPELVVVDNLHHGRLDNLAGHRTDERLDFVAGDIRDPALLHRVFSNAKVVYHLAADRSTPGSVDDADYAFSTNVVGTFNVLRAAVDARVDNLVFSSSCEVYGESIELPVAEDQPLMAVNALGASKIMGEAYCRAFRRTYGLPSVVLRLASVYGTRDVRGAIPGWLEIGLSGGSLPVFGGKQLLDLVWVDQVVEALVRASVATGPLPPVNIGSGTGTRIVDLARRIVRATGARARVSLAPARPFDVTRFVANVSRMRQMLCIEPPDDPLMYLDTLVQSTAIMATA